MPTAIPSPGGSSAPPAAADISDVGATGILLVQSATEDDARTALALGDAAIRNTGTGGTNVILGNDTRLTNPRTPSDSSVTAAKIDTSDAAAIRTAIGAASSVAVTYDFSSSTGWTAGNVGSQGRAASITGGYVEITDTQAHDYDGGVGFGGAEMMRPITDAAEDPTRCELTARIVDVSGGANCRAKMFFRTAGASARICYLAVAANGTVTLGGTGLTDINSSSGAIPVDGTGWIRLVRNGKVVSALYGTGTSSTQPTTWTYLGSVIAPDHSITYGSGTSNGWDRMGFALSATTFPASEYRARWDDLTVRSL